MLSYITRRILYSVPVLIVASFLTFWGLRIAFDPLQKFRNSRSPNAAAILAQHKKELGLDKSIAQQWWSWLWKALHGNLGTSQRTNNAVFGELIHKMGTTVHLVFWGTAISAMLAIGIGLYSAVKQYSIGDYVFTGASYLGVAMPPFWFGLMA